jgi:hypothetical protein
VEQVSYNTIIAARAHNDTARFSFDDAEWVDWPTAYRLLVQQGNTTGDTEAILHYALARIDKATEQAERYAEQAQALMEGNQ